MSVSIHPTADVSPKATVGDGSLIWHQVQIRENARLGTKCTIGRGVYIDVGVLIGNNVKIQNYSSVFHGVTIEDGVFVGPHVCFTNDMRPRAVNKDGSVKMATDWVLTKTLIKEGAAIGAGSVIRYMLDLDLIETITRSRPEWSLVFVGPVDESGPSFYRRVEELTRCANVHFVGQKPAEEIPLYLNAFDVCILPYVQSELTTYYAVPLKFYECLAAGKPVVWSIGPREFPEHILINAQNSGDFVAAISRALTFADPRYVDNRKSMARQNSWEEILREHI